MLRLEATARLYMGVAGPSSRELSHLLCIKEPAVLHQENLRQSEKCAKPGGNLSVSPSSPIYSLSDWD